MINKCTLALAKTFIMPYISVWLHIIWATKNRYPFLRKEIRPLVWDHIKTNARSKNIFIDCVNGHDEHAHCMVSLCCDQTISKTVQLIKGESSFWINKEKLIKEKFEWPDEYYAVSVSQSQIDKVRVYILNQEEHHQKITFQQEYDEFIRRYGFEKVMEKGKT